MADASDLERQISDVFWDSLDGGDYDLEALRTRVKPDSHFSEDLRLDSLDLVDFYLRVEDVTGKKIPQEAYPDLVSIQALVKFFSA